jgi:hypothetical protein
MNDELREILDEIRDEYEVLGFVSTPDWLGEYPEYRTELEAFILELTGELNFEESLMDWPDGGARLREDLLEAMMHERPARAEHRLALRREALSKSLPIPRWSGRNRAQLYAYVVSSARDTPGQVVDRVKAFKAVDLLRRYFSIPGYAFVAHAHGPIDPGLYADEGVAKSEGWIAPPRGHDLAPGEKADDAVTEVNALLPDPIAANELLRVLTPYSGWDLAVWTTVLLMADRLTRRGEPISVRSVKATMAEEEAWKERKGSSPRKAKSDQPEFSDENVADALVHLVRLGMLSEDSVRME